MKLNPITEKFVLHWGEMGSHWGVNRSVAQIHALLFIIGRPMNAEEICDTLNMARSNVSNSIRELHSLKLVHTVHQFGDRRDYFATSDDVWVLVKTIAEQRLQREIEPTLAFLKELEASPEFAGQDGAVQNRIRETRHFMEAATSWTHEMLKLPAATLAQVLKLGAKIRNFLSGKKEG
ncbi:MAG: MarR family transcriptional regulator [Neisseria sp.]|nr:MarR family transcriptional regulator [Neisseria sp.]